MKRKNVIKDKRGVRKFSPLLIETMQRHYRNGHSMEDIAAVMGRSLASISKYCRGIQRGAGPVVEKDEDKDLFRRHVLSAVLKAGPSRVEPVQRHYQTTRETPREIVIKVQPAAGSDGSSSDKPPSEVVRTTRLYSGTLPVSSTDSQLIAFTAPPSNTRSVLVLTASGPCFYARLFTESQYSEYFTRGRETDTWRSPKVTTITQELILPYYGNWRLVFWADYWSDGEKTISVDVSLRTTMSSSTPPAVVPCWVGPPQ